MLPNEVRNKIDKIWTDIWAGGITNPLTVIEQLTYLMFIRSLDEKEIETEAFENEMGEKQAKIFPPDADGQSMRWSKFKNRDAREIFDIISLRVFPFIKTLNDRDGAESDNAFSIFMKDAVFVIPNPQVLQKIITGLDELYEHDIKDLDMQGDLYEYMLSKLSTAGHNGQFRTPKHIREMMVELLAPGPDVKICDPACGTAGFLISGAEYIRKNYGQSMTSEQWHHFSGDMFTGFDTDYTMLRLSTMNLMLHSITHPRIEREDSVSKQNNISSEFDIIWANPPFTGTIDAESINDNLKAVTNTKKTELLFVALFLRMLKKGGRCACIVPDGVLFGNSKAHQSLRKELVDKHTLEAVISMPGGVFKPYAGVSTAVLVFTKTGDGGTKNVWFYDMKADGYSLDDKRNPIDQNDIPDILNRFKNLNAEGSRAKTEQSFFIKREDIEKNNYDLSINRYKEVIYERIEYDKPEVILERLDSLSDEINEKTEELRRLLSE